MSMDIPLLVSPHSLTSLSDDLRAAARRVAQVGDRAAQVAALNGWRGGAEHAFASAARTAGAQCATLSRRLGADAVRVDRLADELVAELAVIGRLEDELVAAVHELARRAADDATGEAAAVYARVRHLLPDHLSPRWRDVGATLGHLL
jgi:hypothetical protein